MTIELTKVPFHGDTITMVERDGEPFVPAKPICDLFGLDWRSQHRKLTDPENDWGVWSMTIPTAGGPQMSIAIALIDFPLWLASISPAKVSEAIRPRLILYRREAKRVLWEHFFLGAIHRDAEAQERIAQLSEQLRFSHAQLLAANPRWSKAMHLVDAGMWWTAIGKRLNLSQTAMHDEKQAMEDCGLLDPAGYKGRTPDSSMSQRIRDLELDLRVAKMRLDRIEPDDRTPLEKIMDGDADA